MFLVTPSRVGLFLCKSTLYLTLCVSLLHCLRAPATLCIVVEEVVTSMVAKDRKDVIMLDETDTYIMVVRLAGSAMLAEGSS